MLGRGKRLDLYTGVTNFFPRYPNYKHWPVEVYLTNQNGAFT